MKAAEFGHPGDGGLGDRLIELILRGEKTATSSLLCEYQRTGEQLPAPGERFLLRDCAGQERGIIEIVEVKTVPFDQVDLGIAEAEGEGFTTVDQWREAHRIFWEARLDNIRDEMGDPNWCLGNDELVVVEFFKRVECSSRVKDL